MERLGPLMKPKQLTATFPLKSDPERIGIRGKTAIKINIEAWLYSGESNHKNTSILIGQGKWQSTSPDIEGHRHQCGGGGGAIFLDEWYVN